MKKFWYALLVGAMMVGVGSNAYSCNETTGLGCNGTTVQVPDVNTDKTSATAENGQFQTQELGVINLGMNGGASNLFQNQAGTGSSSAKFGSAASENQFQGENTSQTLANQVATHNFDSTVVTSGGSVVPSGPGNAFHGEYQTADMSITTLSNAAGTASFSGSQMLIDQCVVAGAKNGTAGAGAANDSHTSYTLANNGPTSNIYQAGRQDSMFTTGAGIGVDRTGGGAANLQASQVGGTAALNNGAGTAMLGGGAATGQVVATNGATKNGFAGSVGEQSQTHAYAQDAGLGTNQSQWSSGSVSTFNSIDSGKIKSGYGVPGF